MIRLVGISIAVPSGALWGIMVDRVGPKPALAVSLLMWMTLLLFAVAVPWLSWTRHF